MSWRRPHTKGHFTHEPRAVTMTLWKPKGKVSKGPFVSLSHSERMYYLVVKTNKKDMTQLHYQPKKPRKNVTHDWKFVYLSSTNASFLVAHDVCFGICNLVIQIEVCSMQNLHYLPSRGSTFVASMRTYPSQMKEAFIIQISFRLKWGSLQLDPTCYIIVRPLILKKNGVKSTTSINIQDIELGQCSQHIPREKAYWRMGGWDDGMMNIVDYFTTLM